MSSKSQDQSDFTAPSPAKRARGAGQSQEPTPDFSAQHATLALQNHFASAGLVPANLTEDRQSTLDFKPENKCEWQMANTHSDHRCQDVPWLERDIRQIQQSVCQYFMWVSGVPEPQPSALARHWYALGRYIWNGLGDREPSEPNPHSCGASDRLQATSSSSYHPASPILERGYTAFRGDFQPNVEEMTEAVRSIFAYKAAPVSKGVKLLALEAWEYLRTNPLLVDWSNYTDEEHAGIAQEKSRLIAELEQIERDAGREELLSKGADCLGSGSRKRSFEAAGLGGELPKTRRSETEIIDDNFDFVDSNWPSFLPELDFDFEGFVFGEFNFKLEDGGASTSQPSTLPLSHANSPGHPRVKALSEGLDSTVSAPGVSSALTAASPPNVCPVRQPSGAAAPANTNQQQPAPFPPKGVSSPENVLPAGVPENRVERQILAKQRRDSGPAGEQMLGRAAPVCQPTNPGSSSNRIANQPQHVGRLMQHAGHQTAMNTSAHPAQRAMPQGGHPHPRQPAPVASAPTRMAHHPSMAMAPGHPVSAGRNTDGRFAFSGPPVGSVPMVRSGQGVPRPVAGIPVSAAHHAASYRPVAAPRPVVASNAMAVHHHMAAPNATAVPHPMAVPRSMADPRLMANPRLTREPRMTNSQWSMPAIPASAPVAPQAATTNTAPGFCQSPSTDIIAYMRHSQTGGHAGNNGSTSAPMTPQMAYRNRYGDAPNPFAVNANAPGFVARPAAFHGQQLFASPEYHGQQRQFGGLQHHGHGQGQFLGHGHGHGHFVGVVPSLPPQQAPVAGGPGAFGTFGAQGNGVGAGAAVVVASGAGRGRGRPRIRGGPPRLRQDRDGR
ncbi:hypothetical protein HDK90DRAFT_524545 [Phyllosticta capitalensis]|uniref:Uncharacterized protein n=1 Tax=Phyllosticta capitalensis TaxID=121624 RepID=A0ABR1YUD2_9PEZI